MARKVRIEFEGAVYHVMDRGDRQEAIFEDDADRELFLSTLGQACGRTGWRIHSYVLMGNHYHLLIETPEANLVAGMRWLQGTYTIRYNARHRRRGHLFQGRYKAVLVDAEERGYFEAVSDYIHLNPVRAGLLGSGEKLEHYRWSSFPWLIGNPRKRPGWLKAERVIEGFGSRDDAAGRRRYREEMERRVSEDGEKSGIGEEALRNLRRGWCFGSDAFRERMLERFDERSRPEERRAVIREGSFARSHNQATAEEIVREGLKAFELREEMLEELAKSDPRKVALASVVKRQTVVTNQWLADRLRMGSPSRVSRYCSGTRGGSDVAKWIATLEMAIRKN